MSPTYSNKKYKLVELVSFASQSTLVVNTQLCTKGLSDIMRVQS